MAFHKLLVIIPFVTSYRNFSDAQPISNAVEDLFQSQAPITPTDTPPVNNDKPKRYNKYGDEIQDDS